MRRLVYSPKVYAAVETDTGVVDLTKYIVSGSVNRVIDAVSTAELVIRNPNRMFTEPPGDPTFRPMDKITIFMARFKNQPVQVFTGYLDQTPYLQLFPGTCTLRASCTLKRLQYTYWDAGLPFTHNFLKKHGWIPNIQTGEILNFKELTKETSRDPEDARITDGGLSKLIRAVLIEAGNWQKEEILIQELPKTVVDTVYDFYRKNVKADAKTEAEYRAFFKDFVGGSGLVPGEMGNSDNPADDFDPTGPAQLVGASSYGYADSGTDGSCGDLTGQMAYAELSTNPESPNEADWDWSALGDLPCGHQLRITVPETGKSVIAKKMDVGRGGGPVNGRVRRIDLWEDTCNALGLAFPFLGVVRVDGLPGQQ